MASATFDDFKARFEQPAEMAADLPTPVKGGNGPRFAEKVDAPVTHLAGTDEAPPPRPKAQHKAKTSPGYHRLDPVAPDIASAHAQDFVRLEEFVAFVRERHAIYERRQAGQPWPWTDNEILQKWRFCNMYRALDKTTIEIWNEYLWPHANDEHVWFALVPARLFNKTSTLQALGYPVPWSYEHFVEVISSLGKGERYGGAYISPVGVKEIGRDKHLTQADYTLGPMWRDREQLQPRPGMTLADFTDGLRRYPGIDGFIAAQIAADAKQVEPLKSALDHAIFALSGTGSRKGMNFILGRKANAPWRRDDRDWYPRLSELHAIITPRYQALGLPVPDYQDTQNQLCEFSKYFEASSGAKTKLKRAYAPPAAPKSTRTRKSPTAKPDIGPQGSPLMQQVRRLSDRLETAIKTGPPDDPGRAQPKSPIFSNDSGGASDPTISRTAAAEPPSYILETESDAKVAAPSTATESKPATTTKPPPASPPSGGNAGSAGRSGNGTWRADGSKTEAKRDTYAKAHAGEPFSDAHLLRRGYQLTQVFDYTLAEGTLLYQQNRYELKPGIPALKERPRKRFLVHRKVNGQDVFDAGDRRVIYNWPAIMRAAPGSFVFVPEGENKAKALVDVGLLATTVLSHEWAPECVAALTGHHLIILADHDKEGERLAADAQRKLAPVAASTRIVPAAHLWKHLPGGKEPQPHDDVVDWITRDHGDPKALLDICPEIPTTGSELDEWDAGESLSNDEPIKPRQWLLARCFCRTFLSGLVAPGDAGKTTLRLTQAVELATNRELLGHHIYQRCRVLVLSLEDDREELRRRLAAICKHHSIDPKELKGWLFCRDLKRVKLATRDKNGERQAGPLEGMLRRAIARTRCDLLILDPFVKLHALAENDNADMDFVCEQLITIAQDCNIAVDSPAHTHKGAITAGDADARRGASAQRDAGRLDYTFTVMSEDEAEKFGIHPDDRRSFVRLDKAKANLTRAVKAEWFKLVSVSLGNTTALYPDGDDMQAIERWKPPETWGDVSSEALNTILNEMEAEMPAGRRYSGKPQATDRAAWKVVQKYCPTKTEAQCREMIREWIKAGVLFEAKYHDPVSRKEEWGLFVDRNKRPQY